MIGKMRIEYGLACLFFAVAGLTFFLAVRALRSGDDVLAIFSVAMGFVALHGSRRLLGDPGAR
jgi:hypothetical protein